LAGVTSAFVAPPIAGFLQGDASVDSNHAKTAGALDFGDTPDSIGTYLGDLRGVGSHLARTLSA